MCVAFISEIFSLLVVPLTPYRSIRLAGSASVYWISSVIIISPNDLFVPQCCASSQPFNTEWPDIKVQNQQTVELNQYSFELKKKKQRKPVVLRSPHRHEPTWNRKRGSSHLTISDVMPVCSTIPQGLN